MRKRGPEKVRHGFCRSARVSRGRKLLHLRFRHSVTSPLVSDLPQPSFKPSTFCVFEIVRGSLCGNSECDSPRLLQHVPCRSARAIEEDIRAGVRHIRARVVLGFDPDQPNCSRCRVLRGSTREGLEPGLGLSRRVEGVLVSCQVCKYPCPLGNSPSKGGVRVLGLGYLKIGKHVSVRRPPGLVLAVRAESVATRWLSHGSPLSWAVCQRRELDFFKGLGLGDSQGAQDPAVSERGLRYWAFGNLGAGPNKFRQGLDVLGLEARSA
ncbi:unnamed protein product [Prunus armeniaca]